MSHASDVTLQSSQEEDKAHDAANEEELPGSPGTVAVNISSPPQPHMRKSRSWAELSKVNARAAAAAAASTNANSSNNTTAKASNATAQQNALLRLVGNNHVDNASLDSYGIPAYTERCTDGCGRVGGTPDGAPLGTGDLSVPWQMRKAKTQKHFSFFDFLRQPQFWKQIEFALRITLISVLVPAALIAAKLQNSPFSSAFAAISATVLAAKGSVGEAVAYLFVWARAGCFWLPLAVIGGALHLGNSIVGWCFYYTIMLFIMAIFTEAMPRRICLLLFNSCMVGLLVDETRGPLYACQVMTDWCIGTGLCVAAVFIPYPLFCKNEAQRHLVAIAKNTGTAFRGLVHSFWSPSNVERNMAMSKVRVMTESLDVLLPAFEHQQAFSFFEFFFEPAIVRDVRDLKFAFFEKLRVNLSSMTRVLDMVEDSPESIDNSDRAHAFGDFLTPHLNLVGEAFDELMDLLATATTRRKILALKPNFDNFRDRVDDLQDAYKLARRMLFYEHTSAVIEEFVPLMTFYLFTVICFRDTIDIFETNTRAFHSDARDTMKRIIVKVAWQPFMDNMDFLRRLCTTWKRHYVQRVIEAAKVSGAMLLTIGFSYLIDVEKHSFSGPNIIAFTSGMNPVEAVQASIVRLTGCLIGTVLGFFAGTYSETAVQRVASLCTLIFFGTFFRNDKEYGIMSVYAMFVLIPLDSILETTVEDTVARMNQNTFGIFIYLVVSILILPLSPSVILRAKRVNVLKRMSDCISDMMLLFSTPLVAEQHMRQVAGVFEGAENGHSIGVSNRSMYMMSQTDTALEDLNTVLLEVIRRLKGTKEMMGFAKDERGIVTIDYPVKECVDVYAHMYRMTFLMKTMWMSWNVMRSQLHYTPETRRMLRNLQPIARDISQSFRKIVDQMTYMMRDPSVNLEGEIMKGVLELIDASRELHTRKSQIMLVLINTSVEQYRMTHDENGITRPNSGTEPNYNERIFNFTEAPAKSDSQTTPPPPYTNFRVVPSEKNVSILPYLRQMPRGDSGDAMGDDCGQGPVRLPCDFEFPVTSEDAEGLHSFTLCLEMFSNETKLLIMSLGVMLDHLRSKL